MACIRVGCCLFTFARDHVRQERRARGRHADCHAPGRATDSIDIDADLADDDDDDVYDDVELVRLRSASPGDVGDFGQS